MKSMSHFVFQTCSQDLSFELLSVTKVYSGSHKMAKYYGISKEEARVQAMDALQVHIVSRHSVSASLYNVPGISWRMALKRTLLRQSFSDL